jgi:hypothetical protein
MIANSDGDSGVDADGEGDDADAGAGADEGSASVGRTIIVSGAKRLDSMLPKMLKGACNCARNGGGCG